MRRLLFLTLFSLYALTNSGFDSTEGLEDLRLAGHVLDSGTLGFDSDPGGVSAQGPDGRYFLSHDIGNAIALIPAVVAGRALERVARARTGAAIADQSIGFVASFAPALFAALTAVALFDAIAVGLGRGEFAATATALALGLSTMLWPYARSLFDGVLATLLVTGAFALLLRARRTGRTAAFIGAGLLIGLATVTRQPAIVLVPPAALFLLMMAHRRGGLATTRRAALAFAVPLLLCLAWQAYYNAVRSGAALVPPTALPKYAGNNALDGNIAVGLLGFVVSPGKSILLFSPAIILSCFGLRAFWRHDRAACALVVASTGGYLLLHAAIRNWSGEWGWGPRYTLLVTPLMLVPAAYVFRPRSDGSVGWGRIGIAATLASGVLVQLAAVTINWHYRYSFVVQREQIQPAILLWNVSRGQFADSLHTAAVNLGRITGSGVPADVVHGASALNVIASNGINVWWLTALHGGVPRWMPALVVVPLAAVFAVSLVGCCRRAGGGDSSGHAGHDAGTTH